MDIGFFTNAGTDSSWSLDECAAWARANDFDCVRLSDTGAADTHRIVDQGPNELKDGLARHDIYLACLTAHCASWASTKWLSRCMARFPPLSIWPWCPNRQPRKRSRSASVFLTLRHPRFVGGAFFMCDARAKALS